MTRLLTTLLVLGGAAYGATWFVRQRKLLKKSCLRIKWVRINKIGINETNLTIVLLIKNKSDIDLTLINQSYNIFLDGKSTGTTTIYESVVLPSHSEITSEATLSFNPGQLLGVLAMSISNLKKVILRISGSLTVKSGLLSFNRLPVDYEESIGEILEGDSEPC